MAMRVGTTEPKSGKGPDFSHIPPVSRREKTAVKKPAIYGGLASFPTAVRCAAGVISLQRAVFGELHPHRLHINEGCYKIGQLGFRRGNIRFSIRAGAKPVTCQTTLITIIMHSIINISRQVASGIQLRKCISRSEN